MGMYAKVFTSMFDGSMRGHPDQQLVFINLLAHADQDGIVDRHWKAIVDETGLPEASVRKALGELESPDKDSRSRNDDGRRIRRIDPDRDWGWEIINYAKYDGIRNSAERREYMRNFMAEKRKQKVLADVSNVLAPVSNVSLLSSSSSSSTTTKNKIAVKDKNPSQPATVSRIKMADEEWLKSIRAEYAQIGINVDTELVKARTWAQSRGRQVTQRMFVNWLNRSDRNVTAPSAAKAPVQVTTFALIKRKELLEEQLGHARNESDYESIRRLKGDLAETNKRILEATK